MFECFYCKKDFNRKYHVDRHYSTCKVYSNLSPLQITNLFHKELSIRDDRIKSLENQVSISLSHSNNNNINSHNVIVVNAINKLDLKCVVEEHMLEFLRKVEQSTSMYDVACVEYIHKILNNKEHPENRAVKLVRKSPIFFDTIVEYDDKYNMVKNLQDTSQILDKPLVDFINYKIKECKNKYPNYVFSGIEEIDDVIKCVKKLNKHCLSNNIRLFLKELAYTN